MNPFSAWACSLLLGIVAWWTSLTSTVLFRIQHVICSIAYKLDQLSTASMFARTIIQAYRARGTGLVHPSSSIIAVLLHKEHGWVYLVSDLSTNDPQSVVHKPLPAPLFCAVLVPQERDTEADDVIVHAVYSHDMSYVADYWLEILGNGSLATTLSKLYFVYTHPVDDSVISYNWNLECQTEAHEWRVAMNSPV